MKVTEALIRTVGIISAYRHVYPVPADCPIYLTHIKKKVAYPDAYADKAT